MEAKLLVTKSEVYGPTHMRRKRKDCFKGYITFCHKEGKSDVVMLNSKLLHEFHLESGRKDKNEEKLSHLDSYKTHLVRYHITKVPGHLYI